MQARVVFDDGRYRIVLHPGTRPDILVVAFDPMFVFAHEAKAGFGVTFLTQAGLSVLAISKYRECFYQHLDPEVLRRLAPPDPVRRTVTYGSSVGAYAALYFSGVLDAAALAFSPRLPVHPVVRTPDGPYRAVTAPHLHPVDYGAAISGRDHLIIHDPWDDIDRRFVETTLGHLPPQTFTRAWLFGHPTIQPLVQLGLAKAMALDFITKGTRPSSAFRRQKGRSSRYLAIASIRAARTGHAATALNLADRALAAGETSLSHAIHRFRLLMTIDRPADAIAAFDGHTLAPAELALVAKAHANLENWPAALEALDQALALASGAPAWLLRDTADILWRAGKHKQAFSTLDEAQILFPADLAFSQRRSRWEKAVRT